MPNNQATLRTNSSFCCCCKNKNWKPGKGNQICLLASDRGRNDNVCYISKRERVEQLPVFLTCFARWTDVWLVISGGTAVGREAVWRRRTPLSWPAEFFTSSQLIELWGAQSMLIYVRIWSERWRLPLVTSRITIVFAEWNFSQCLPFLHIGFFMLSGSGSISGQSQEEIVLGAPVVLGPTDTWDVWQ